MRLSHKTLALIFCLSFISLQNVAQTKRSIFRMGIRHVDMTGDVDLRGSRSFTPAIDLGFGVSYKMASGVYFEPELHYSPRGYSSKFQFTDSTNIKSNISLHYLDLCPNFSFVLGSKSKPGRTPVHLWVGPYLGYGFTGSATTDELAVNKRTNKADTTITTSIFPFTNGVKRIDYGINVGLGVRLENFVNVGVTYSRGFNDLADDRRYGSIYNQSWGVYVAVLFDDIF